ncbi:MAG: class I SAM-dependent methyltransferase [Actinobacteria bacterium]|nr:class I SAM-dependent methyltransferase [Actinomycetota bacterium]
METKAKYKKYYQKKGQHRNDILKDRGVLFQQLALEACLVNALRYIGFESDKIKLLDVGCGEGASLAPFLIYGFNSDLMFGIDILDERIEEARRRFPAINWICGDAAHMGFPDEEFDVVLESTMFYAISDQSLASLIASEMVRVTKPSGFILLVDWRYGVPWEKEFRAVTKRRIKRLFNVGDETLIEKTFNGALVPPIGRFLSKHLPATYFLIQKVMPILVGMKLVILRKSGDNKDASF